MPPDRPKNPPKTVVPVLLPPKALAWAAVIPPKLIVVAPEYVLLPFSNKVPGPDLITCPRPVMVLVVKFEAELTL